MAKGKRSSRRSTATSIDIKTKVGLGVGLALCLGLLGMFGSMALNSIVSITGTAPKVASITVEGNNYNPQFSEGRIVLNWVSNNANVFTVKITYPNQSGRTFTYGTWDRSAELASSNLANVAGSYTISFARIDAVQVNQPFKVMVYASKKGYPLAPGITYSPLITIANYCGNGLCEIARGESTLGCAKDCTCPANIGFGDLNMDSKVNDTDVAIFNNWKNSAEKSLLTPQYACIVRDQAKLTALPTAATRLSYCKARLGDLNRDGRIDGADQQLMINFTSTNNYSLLGLQTFYPCADMNADGLINSVEVQSENNCVQNLAPCNSAGTATWPIPTIQVGLTSQGKQVYAINNEKFTVTYPDGKGIAYITSKVTFYQSVGNSEYNIGTTYVASTGKCDGSGKCTSEVSWPILTSINQYRYPTNPNGIKAKIKTCVSSPASLNTVCGWSDEFTMYP